MCRSNALWMTQPGSEPPNKSSKIILLAVLTARKVTPVTSSVKGIATRCGNVTLEYGLWRTRCPLTFAHVSSLHREAHEDAEEGSGCMLPLQMLRQPVQFSQRQRPCLSFSIDDKWLGENYSIYQPIILASCQERHFKWRQRKKNVFF